MTHDGLEQGFTIIEISIFLAITGLMMAMAFAGTQALVNNTRFNDTTRSLESFVQNQFEEVRNGVNSRDGSETCTTGVVTDGGSSTPGTTDNCLLLGKVIYFAPDSAEVRSYFITGQAPDPDDLTGNNHDDIKLASPKISPVGTESYDIPWEAQFKGSNRDNDDANINMIAIIRSPSSSYIGVYNVNNGPNPPGTNPPSSILANNELNAGINSSATYCIESVDFPPKRAAIVVERGSGSSIVTLNNDPDWAAEC